MSDVVVLCYHAVSPDWPAQLSVTPERFEHQLRELVGRGYRGATFTEAVTSPPHPRTLAVTFDDGMRSVLERARPVLGRLGLPATVFVPTDLVGSEGPMSWRGIEQWVDGEHGRELVPLDVARAERLAGRRLGDRLPQPDASAAGRARRRRAGSGAEGVTGAAGSRARRAVHLTRVPLRRGRRSGNSRSGRGRLPTRPGACRRASTTPLRCRGRAPASGTATGRSASG